MVSIYILKCINSKYYVGRTDDLKFRIDNHFNNKGSFWTQVYKPIKVLKIIKKCTIYDEDKYTIMMMTKYGINNVRGGTFSNFNLNNNEIRVINKMIRNAHDKCFNCGSNHFINNCTTTHIAEIFNALLDNIIRLCNKIDENFNGRIDVKNFLRILLISDSVIFKDIHSSDLNKFIDSNNITDNLIDYYSTSKNIILFLNNNYKSNN